jgi:ribosome recycling factor
MNKALYNWLDKVEGKKVGSTVKNITAEKRRQGVKLNQDYAKIAVRALRRLK